MRVLLLSHAAASAAVAAALLARGHAVTLFGAGAVVAWWRMRMRSRISRAFALATSSVLFGRRTGARDGSGSDTATGAGDTSTSAAGAGSIHGGTSASTDAATGLGMDAVACSGLSSGSGWLRRGLPEVACEIEVACASVADAGAPPVVMGHSMGGLAALAYAAAGHALSALVLLTPVVPKPFGGEPIGLPVNASGPFGSFPPDVARELFFDGVEAEQAAQYAARLQVESPTAVWQATRWTAEVDVSKIQVSTLVVAAERDRLVPPPYVAALAEAMHARLLVLPGVGHGVELNPGWEGLLAEIVPWIEALT